MVTITLSRKGVEDLAVLEYAKELEKEKTEKEREHFEHLIRGKAVAHLRVIGYKIECIPNSCNYKVTII